MDYKIQKYMDIALALALKAKGEISPNPLVGAVVVKNNRVIATGFHKRAGEPHAEAVALGKAGKKAKGATLYVTLEPCSSFGRTPPCTDAIIQSGIDKVVIGMQDPNPKHYGRAAKILRKSGITVVSSVSSNACRDINQPFIKYITRNMPYVTLKVAQSLDGKIATKTGDSKWITSEDSRRLARNLRGGFDAIMVGINTVLRDDPGLNPAKITKAKKFYKIVLDTQLKISASSKVFKDSRRFPVIVATHTGSLLNKAAKVKSLVEKEAIILGVEKQGAVLNFKDLLKKLAYLEIASILVEGGGRVAGSLLDQGLIDSVWFFIAPKIIGGSDSVLSIQGRGIKKIDQATKLQDVEIQRLGDEVLVQGLLKKY